MKIPFLMKLYLGISLLTFFLWISTLIISIINAIVMKRSGNKESKRIRFLNIANDRSFRTLCISNLLLLPFVLHFTRMLSVKFFPIEYIELGWAFLMLWIIGAGVLGKRLRELGFFSTLFLLLFFGIHILFHIGWFSTELKTPHAAGVINIWIFLWFLLGVLLSVEFILKIRRQHRQVLITPTVEIRDQT